MYSSSAANSRQSTGVPGLDELLGGGLLPGTLTVVVGATGCGKTQLGVQFAQAGRRQEGRSGVIVDLTARGDSQSHAEYAERMFQWLLVERDPGHALDLERFYEPHRVHGDYLHLLDRTGRRVRRQEADWQEWYAWQAELNARLPHAIGFLYGNLIQRAQRVVVDGVEPVDRPEDSIQFHLFDYLYQQIVRKDPEWVARDLFREAYRAHASNAEGHTYDPRRISCLLLATCREMLLDDLVGRPLVEGDPLATANTLIYLGKIRSGQTVRRGLYIAKHRGSACSDQVVTYTITDQGLQVN